MVLYWHEPSDADSEAQGSSRGRRRWYAAGGWDISRVHCDAEDARTGQRNYRIVVPWNADGPPLEVQLISAAACSLVAADTSLGSAPMALNLIYKVLMLELLKYDYGCASVRSRARGVCVCV